MTSPASFHYIVDEHKMGTVVIDGESLTISEVVRVARHYDTVKITKEASEKVSRSRETLEYLIAEQRTIYGVTTGFGGLGKIKISPSEAKQLQVNLIRSHSSGVGKPLSRETTRALMLLRANTLAKGYSGIRLKTLQTLVMMINKHVHPIIPEKGSVGASGDLAPLSHMALVMIGEGKAEYQSDIIDGSDAMRESAVDPVELDWKEGVALNNGTQMMTAIAAISVHNAECLIRAAEAAASLSVEALCGITDAFDEKIHSVRPHKGQIKTARNIRKLLSGSHLARTSDKSMAEHQYPQDPYSLRCIPQVLGSVRDTVRHVREVVEVEINSATDNPLVFTKEGVCLSGGNFHGQPISVAMDFLAITLTSLGVFSERRTARLIDEKLNRGLPAFLIHIEEKRGIQSGFMTLQYTAAALASENKSLAHPASVDSIPTSANFEDFVSMGSIAARKAAEILRNTQFIIAIELLCAAQGAELRGAEKLGVGTKLIYDLVRSRVPFLEEDRPLFNDIEAIRNLICEGNFDSLVNHSR